MNQPEHLIAVGDVRKLLPLIPSGSIHCAITSPPYWGLRDYGTGRWDGGDPACDHVRQHYRTNLAASVASTRGGAKKVAETPPLLYQGTCEKCGATRVDDQIGMEPTIEEYVETMVAVFREVRRILRDDGILWLNLGDCYANVGRSDEQRRKDASGVVRPSGEHECERCGKPFVGGLGRRFCSSFCGGIDNSRRSDRPGGLKSKDLCLIPERVVLALQEPYRVPCCVKSNTDRAWLAAMFDGEGCIGIKRYDSGRTSREQTYQDGFVVYTVVTNNDIELLDRCVAVTGFGSVKLKQKAESTDNRGIVSRRDSHGWRLDGNKAVDVVRAIYPYLIAKRKQACIAYTLDRLNKQGREIRGNKAVPRENQEKRSYLKELINRCNQREPVDLPSWIEEPKEEVQPGWWVRAKPPWLKPNPMPESVEDRPTTAHESIFLLTKGVDYFYDIDATRSPLATKSAERYAYAFGGAKAQALYDADKDGMGVRTVPIGFREPTAGRNRRSADWFLESLDEAIDHHRAYLAHLERIRANGGMLVDETGETPLGFKVATTPFKNAHFATFPPRLVEPMIRAGTSEAGCCPKCGEPWKRVIERDRTFESGSGKSGNLPVGKNGDHLQGGGATIDVRRGPTPSVRTLGWKCFCLCSNPPLAPVPCTVFDPFSGAATTGSVADGLGRRFVGLELNPAYAAMGARRIHRPHAPAERPPAPARGQQTLFD